jgi:hypothetical protein
MSAILPNFDWALSPLNQRAESQVAAAAKVQYRLDSTMCLTPFDIKTKKDKKKPAAFYATALIQGHLRLFLAKKLLLGWLYLKRDTMFLNANCISRLAAYVRYYDQILEEVRKGDNDILERWWALEMGFENSQHSASRVPRPDGVSEADILASLLIDWNLEQIVIEDNIALISNDDLDTAVGHVSDWIGNEVLFELPQGDSDTDMDCELSKYAL